MFLAQTEQMRISLPNLKKGMPDSRNEKDQKAKIVARSLVRMCLTSNNLDSQRCDRMTRKAEIILAWG